MDGGTALTEEHAFRFKAENKDWNMNTRRTFLGRRASRCVALAACTMLTSLWAVSAGAQPVSVIITKVKCIDNCRNTGLEAAGESAADFFAKVAIDGVVTTTPRGDEDQVEITPNWVVSAIIPPKNKSFHVTIQIWDHDSTSGDDLGDTSPVVGKNNLDFDVDAVTGQWSGELKWPEKCAQGGNPGGEPAVEVCIDIGGFADSDGDGLLDSWEINGLDADRDGMIDVDLPAMGANPNHKDLFVELDWMANNAPTGAAIRTWKAAFAAAPVNAGRTDDPSKTTITQVNNPDGKPGINLWVDTGGLLDTNPAGSEGGAGANTCSDTLDNDGDGFADAADSKCRTGPRLAGDKFLGGNQVATLNVSGLTPNFYAIKNAPGNFNPKRALVFHYALSAANPTNNTGTSTGTNTATTLNDTTRAWLTDEWKDRTVTLNGGAGVGQVQTIVSNTATRLVVTGPWAPIPNATSTYTIGLTGGQGETGGNDYVEFNHDPGTLMHELGHNLNLQHGGIDDVNCKPNYISVMSYDLQFGIPQNPGSGQGQDLNGDGTLEIIDYSPPRTPTGRRNAPLATLIESSLSDGTVLDSADAANQFIYTRGPAGKFTLPLNQGIDWAGDGATTSGGVLNINTSGTNGRPASCTNLKVETLAGSNDWNFISLNLRYFKNSANSAVNPEKQVEPTLDDRKRQAEELNTTDLVLTKTATAAVPVAGQEIVYRFTVKNSGPRVARIVRLIDPLPKYLTFVSGSPGCAVDAAGTMNCELGLLRVGEQRDLEARLHIAVDLPCRPQDQFLAVENRARVLNVPGPDSSPQNNEASTSTQILCVRYEYAAKLICGRQTEPQDLALALGQYATAINIHNPNDEKVQFFKKVALTERDQKPGRVLPVAIDGLLYDEALRLDCVDLRRRLARTNSTEALLEGFAIIQSPRSLDVTGVYTTSALRCEGSNRSDYLRKPDEEERRQYERPERKCVVERGPASIHLEQIRERHREEAKPAERVKENPPSKQP